MLLVVLAPQVRLWSLECLPLGHALSPRLHIQHPEPCFWDLTYSLPLLDYLVQTVPAWHGLPVRRHLFTVTVSFWCHTASCSLYAFHDPSLSWCWTLHNVLRPSSQLLLAVLPLAVIRLEALSSLLPALTQCALGQSTAPHTSWAVILGPSSFLI